MLFNDYCLLFIVHWYYFVLVCPSEGEEEALPRELRTGNRTIDYLELPRSKNIALLLRHYSGITKRLIMYVINARN